MEDNPFKSIVSADEDQFMNLPQSYGIGFACRLSDAISFDLDVYKTHWQNYYITLSNGFKVNPFTGGKQSESNTRPTCQVRMGGEYLYISDAGYSIPVRCGLFYDPEPTSDQPDDFLGISLGSGYNYDSIVFDLAYQYRWGNQVRQFKLLNQNISQNIKQHSIYMSVIYHFK